MAETRMMPIAEIDIGKRYRKDFGDLETLAKSIESEGLLHPIGITLYGKAGKAPYKLLFGLRRLLAVHDVLKHQEIEARILDFDSIVTGEYAENEIRKDFTPSERVAIGKALEAEIGERRGAPQKEAIVAKCPQLPKGQKTRDVVAEKVGFGSGKSYERAKAKVEARSPELQALVDTGEFAESEADILQSGFSPSKVQQFAKEGAKFCRAKVREIVQVRKELDGTDEEEAPKCPRRPSRGKAATVYSVSDSFAKWLSDCNSGLQKLKQTYGPSKKIGGAMAKMLGSPKWDQGQTTRLKDVLRSVAEMVETLNREMQAQTAVKEK